MKKVKRMLSLVLAMVMMLTMSGMSVMAAEPDQKQEGYIEISLDEASTYASNYYSRGLVVLNIATAGVSKGV